MHVETSKVYITEDLEDLLFYLFLFLIVAYLLKKAKKKAPIQISDIVFSISPIINAAGRMDHAHGAVKLMLAADDQEAEEIGRASCRERVSSPV